MKMTMAFWTVLLLWIVFGAFWYLGLISLPLGTVTNYAFLLTMFGLLGWQVFGPPLGKPKERRQ